MLRKRPVMIAKAAFLLYSRRTIICCPRNTAESIVWKHKNTGCVSLYQGKRSLYFSLRKCWICTLTNGGGGFPSSPLAVQHTARLLLCLYIICTALLNQKTSCCGSTRSSSVIGRITRQGTPAATTPAGISRATMLMCRKVTHKNLIDSTPLFRNSQIKI